MYIDIDIDICSNYIALNMLKLIVYFFLFQYILAEKRKYAQLFSKILNLIMYIAL